jgi:hypothetical protein
MNSILKSQISDRSEMADMHQFLRRRMQTPRDTTAGRTRDILSPDGSRIWNRQEINRLHGGAILTPTRPVRKHRTRIPPEDTSHSERLGTDAGNVFVYENDGQWRRVLRREDLVAIRNLFQERYGDLVRFQNRLGYRWVFLPDRWSGFYNPRLKTDFQDLDPGRFPFAKWPTLFEIREMSMSEYRKETLADLFGSTKSEAYEFAVAETLKLQSAKILVPALSRYSELLYIPDMDIPSVMVNPRIPVAIHKDIVNGLRDMMSYTSSDYMRYSAASRTMEIVRHIMNPDTYEISNLLKSKDSMMDWHKDLKLLTHVHAISMVVAMRNYVTNISSDHENVFVKVPPPPPALFKGNSYRIFHARIPGDAGFEDSGSDGILDKFMPAMIVISLGVLHTLQRVPAALRYALYSEEGRMCYYKKAIPFHPADDSGEMGGFLTQFPFPAQLRPVLSYYLALTNAFESPQEDAAAVMDLKISQGSWFAWLQAVSAADEKHEMTWDQEARFCMLWMWTAIARGGFSIRFLDAENNLVRTFHDIHYRDAKGEEMRETSLEAERRSSNLVESLESSFWADTREYAHNVHFVAVMGDPAGAVRHYGMTNCILMRPFTDTRISRVSALDMDEKDAETGERIVRMRGISARIGIPRLEERSKDKSMSPFRVAYPVIHSQGGGALQGARQTASVGGQVLESMSTFHVLERVDETNDEILMHPVGMQMEGDGSDRIFMSRWTPWRYVSVRSKSRLDEMYIQVAETGILASTPQADRSEDSEFLHLYADANPVEDVEWRYKLDAGQLGALDFSALIKDEDRPVRYLDIRNRKDAVDATDAYFTPDYEWKMYGHILRTEAGGDFGLHIHTKQVAHPMGGRTHAKHAKTNLWPRGIVDGFRLRDGLTLYFEMTVVETDRGVDGFDYDIYMGNMQIRGDRSTWKRAWTESYRRFVHAQSDKFQWKSVPDYLLPLSSAIDPASEDVSNLGILLPDEDAEKEENVGLLQTKDLCERIMKEIDAKIRILQERKRHCQDVIAAISRLDSVVPTRDFLADLHLKTSYLQIPPPYMPVLRAGELRELQSESKAPIPFGDKQGQFVYWKFLPESQAVEKYGEERIAKYQRAYEEYVRRRDSAIENSKA